MSVINITRLITKDQEGSCGYCNSDQQKRRKVGFRTTKLNVFHYDKLIEKGFMRHGGALFAKVTNEDSCCHVLNPRVDITEFKISKQQKKHMKRFNQYMNGEREFEPTKLVIPVLTDKQAMVKRIQDTAYKTEISRIRNLILEMVTKLCQFNTEYDSRIYTDTCINIIKDKHTIKLATCEELEDTPKFISNIHTLLVAHLEGYDVTDSFILLNYLKNDLEFKESYKVMSGDELVSICYYICLLSKFILFPCGLVIIFNLDSEHNRSSSNSTTDSPEIFRWLPA
jgi:hypothetical protein